VLGLAGVLRSVARDRNGELARVGEDQFVLHLPKACASTRRPPPPWRSTPCTTTAWKRAQRVISGITVSIGIAMYPFHGNEWASLLAAMDAATHQAKDLGRNRVALFNPASDALRANHRRTHWSRLLTEALSRTKSALRTAGRADQQRRPHP